MRMDLRFDNMVELYQKSCEAYSERPLFGTRRKDGWEWTSYGELREQVDRLRGGLANLGIGQGDRVAIVSHNRVEWACACFAVYGLGATFVPMYEAQLPREWQFILGDCGAKAVLAGTEKIRRALEEMRADLPALEHVIGIDAPPDEPSSYAALLRTGDEHPVEPKSPAPESVAAFVYTSGTTGDPKGAILTHKNFASNVTAVMQIFRFEPEDRALSFLPWAHAYGQVAELYFLMATGASAALNQNLVRLLDDFQEVKPTIFIGVPKIFNRIYERVHERIAKRSPIVQRLFRDGLEGARRRARGQSLSPWQRLELSLDDRLIFSKVREGFGGRLRFVISAAAALSPEVAEFIEALGITVYEGYGLTETSPVVSGNTPAHQKPGTVGKVIPGVRVEIGPADTEDPNEGEVIVYGPNVMKGYHNRPEENEQAFTPDGGFRTGDLGFLDDEGFLHLTGRIKDQFKLENGKYVMPAPVEEKLKLSPYISNIMLHGANRPFVVALVSIDVPAVEEWARRQGIELSDPARDERVHDLIERELDSWAEGLRRYEVPKRFIITTEELAVENDMLTPTLKIKRRNVSRRYGDELEDLYRAAAQPPRAAAR